MAFFDDMASAIQTYPDSNVKLKIIDFKAASGTLNSEEDATFKVSVTNNGPLNMSAVKVKALAEGGAQMYDLAAAGTLHDFVTPVIDSIPGNGGSVTSRQLALKAPKVKKDAKDIQLVTVTLDAWDPDLTSFLVDKSVASAKATDSHTETVNPI